MSSLIALTGDMYAGKTGLARALEKEGYLLISFTDLLKKYAVDSLAACGNPVTLEEVLKDKAKYRPYLQELARLIGFNNNPKYVYESLAPWTGGPCVFDNVRTPEQWSVLQSYGFSLAEVRVEKQVQEGRARNLGVTGSALQLVSRHPIEGLLCGRGSIVLDGFLPPEYNARIIMHREEEQRG